MLSDLTIIDLSRLVPGPFCTMLLADLGARVISISSPTGPADVTAVRFPSLERNKESVVLDLRKDAAREAFFRLVKTADAVVEGYRPGTLKRLGIGYEAASAVNPRIVYASITGYGQDRPTLQAPSAGPGSAGSGQEGPPGKSRAPAGHDLNFLARSGVLDLMMADDAPPRIPAVQFADTAGSMIAALALLAAIRERDRTGHGRHLDISMTDAVQCLAVTSATFREAGWPWKANQSFVGGGLACFGAYRAKDGRLLAVGAVEAGFFRNLCTALDVPELIPNQYDPAKQSEIRGRLEGIFATRTLEEWETFFAQHDACVTGAARFDAALDDPTSTRRGAVREAVDDDGRKRRVVGAPIAWPSEFPPGGRVPSTGEHTESVLREFGFSDEEIAKIMR